MQKGTGPGPGSSTGHTRGISKFIESSVVRFHIKDFLGIPCGGMHWMPKVLRMLHSEDSPVKYHGTDIVSHVIEQHKQTFANETDWYFAQQDISTAEYSMAYDLILSRDVMFRLDERGVECSKDNFSCSQSMYRMCTSTPGHGNSLRTYRNSNVVTWTPTHLGNRKEKGELNNGSFRRVDLST